jgi:formate transporter
MDLSTMSYISPQNLLKKIIDAGEAKVKLSTEQTLIRAFMAGALLALAAAFAITVTVTSGQPLLGAILFPVGFILLTLLGFDLLTGVFTLTPLALLDRREGVTVQKVFRNWTLTFTGNFLGAFTVAVMMAVVFTFGFSSQPNAVGQKISEIGFDRTVGYSNYGFSGMLTLFVRGILCNWMVSTAIVAGLASTNVAGKAVVMWMPIMVFFYMGFEHSIVNMFLFPSGLLLGAEFSIYDYLVWNEIPTIVGNLVGGITFVGLPLYLAHRSDGLTGIVSDNDNQIVSEVLTSIGERT